MEIFRQTDKTAEVNITYNQSCQDDTDQGFTGNQTGSDQQTGVVNNIFVFLTFNTFLRNLINDVFNQTANKNGESSVKRQILF